jgi:hypothetical protein
VADYLNGVEILGEPKTVRLNMKFRGEIFSGSLEVWVSAMVSVMNPEQKAILFQTVKSLAAGQDRLSAEKGQKARVVADIPMPNIKE